MASKVVSLVERRAEKQALESLPTEQRALVAANAASSRQQRFRALIRHLSPAVAEILAWYVAEQQELGVPINLSQALMFVFGGEVDIEALIARAEQLRKAIPSEAATLQRLLDCPVIEFPGGEFQAKLCAERENIEDLKLKIHALELENILMRARAEGLISAGYARQLQDKWLSPSLTEAQLWELIAAHGRGTGAAS